MQEVTPKTRKVVDDSNLPFRVPIIAYALIYWLYSDKYSYPLWLDIISYSVMAVLALALFADGVKATKVKLF